MNKKYMPWAIGGLSVAVLLAIWLNLPVTPTSELVDSSAYFYDAQSGLLYAASKELIPPAIAPSDGEAGTRSGFEAFVFGCGSCSGETTFSYMTKYTEDVVEIMQKGEPSQVGGEDEEGVMTQDALLENLYEASPTSGMYVRTPDSQEWHHVNSEEGKKIVASISTICDDASEIVKCTPGNSSL